MARSKRTIWVDIDKKYDIFKELVEPVYREYLDWISNKLGLCLESINIRKSSNGNTHVIVNLCYDIEDPVEYVFLHFTLGCDPVLASLGMLRLRLYGDPIIRRYERKKSNKKNGG